MAALAIDPTTGERSSSIGYASPQIDPQTGERVDAQADTRNGFQKGVDNLTKIEPSNTRPGIMGHLETAAGNFGGGVLSPLGLLAHPIQTGKSLANTLSQGQYGAGPKIFQDTPSIGESLGKSFHDNPSGTLENLAGGLVGGAVTGEGLRAGGGAIADAIPTRAKAGALLDTASRAAGNEPVSLTRSQIPLGRMSQLAESGGGPLPQPVSQLLGRSQRIFPMTYNEARDFQSGLGNMSRSDADMSGSMNGQFKNLRGSLHDDIGDTADRAGVGDEYRNGMKTYRQAMRNRDFLMGAGQKIGKTALLGAGAGAAGKIAYDIFGRPLDR